MKRIAIFLGIFLFLCGCSRDANRVQVSFVDSTGKKVASFSSEVVADEKSRMLGLMYRKDMGDDQGMLFVFPAENERSFWMKNTYIELDMIYMNASKKVISIIERAAPLSETPRLSVGKAQYVLEIKGGLSRGLGIKEGQQMEVAGDLPPGR